MPVGFGPSSTVVGLLKRMSRKRSSYSPLARHSGTDRRLQAQVWIPLTPMARQVFALIIGIDNYESNDIWNLHSAAKDARRIEQWLVRDFQVPRSHICRLLDHQATKRNIEDIFMTHLVNNPAIEPGDALVVYFAGHGSSIRAPAGWFDQGRGDVPVLCPYDYDVKSSSRHTNTGISDRSLHAMLQDLAQVKGDNITLILDTC
ncbi:hypothetical protein NUW54_g12171 [Trametes sanguinea]|uniref:Uncharacterized protein n=1 Tax=Trametes sanguinea TaxID=158606 RepID=A0ACC1N0U4_9APHY|nr:hypothetical protein NUW54_g12171 [Trametes sanguinea]